MKAFLLLSFPLLLCVSVRCFAGDQEPLNQQNIAKAISTGNLYFEKGDYVNAIEKWKSVLTTLEESNQAGMSSRKFDLYLSIASSYHQLGFHQSARAELLVAKSYLVSASGKIAQINWLNLSGNLYLTEGKYEKALHDLSLASAYSRKQSDKLVMARTLNDYANALWASGYDSEAEAMYKESLSYASVNTNLSFSIQLNLIDVFLAQNKQQLAYDQFEILRSKLTRVSRSAYNTRFLLALVKTALKLYENHNKNGLASDIFFWLKLVEKQNKVFDNDTTASYIHGYRGRIYELNRDYVASISSTQNAIYHAQKAEFDESLYLWQWQLARVYRAQGDLEAAYDMLRLAVSSLAPVRRDLVKAYRKTNQYFINYIRPVYTDLVEVTFQKVKSSVSQKQRTAFLKAARSVTEELKTAELEDYYQDECVLRAQQKAVSLDDSEPGTAIIYPIILSNSLELLVSMPDQLLHFSIAISEDRFENTAKRFRAAVQNPDSKKYQAYARRLYKWLVQPLENDLNKQSINMLVFVPEGILRNIPFSALMKKNRYLIEDFGVAITPGLTLTALSEQKRKHSSLVGGISEAVQGFSPLVHVEDELQSIHAKVGGRLLQNKEYTLKNLERALRENKYSMVHLATHGVFGSSPENSFLLTYDQKLSMNKFESLVRIGQFREQELELLTLSACETAVGDQRSGLGFAGVAIKASARSAIASYWLVDDQATSALMTQLYRHLGSGVAKAEALRRAQLESIKLKDYQHPTHWSAFVLIGNWR